MSLTTDEPDESDPLLVSDLRWTLDEVTRVERVDRLTLDADELSHYARELQQECRWLRALVHEALRHVQRLTAQLRAARLTIWELRRERPR